MSLNRKKAIDIMKKASGGMIEEKSATEIPHGFLAVLTGKNQVICVTDGACAFADRLECTIDEYRYGVRIRFAEMSNKNSQALRFFLKWTAPGATGEKDSMGFEDDFGLLLPVAANELEEEEIKPVLLSHTDSAEKLALAMGDAAWQALTTGLVNGYGSEFSYAQAEQEVMNALLCGYTSIVVDASAKVDMSALELSDADLKNKFDKLNEEFQEALKLSYVDKKFTVAGIGEFSYSEQELRQYSLCYGEAIAFLQYTYNAYFKGAPWTVDFIVYLGKQDLTYKAHYLLANELGRAGVKLVAIEASPDSQDFKDNTKVAANFSHKLRLVLAKELTEENKNWLKESKSKFDLRPPKGSGLLLAYQAIKDLPAIKELGLDDFAGKDLLDKLVANKELVKTQLIANKEIYFELFHKQIEIYKNLLKK